MAAMNTSSSVKPRVVIFHMTASQLIRSIASLYKARVVPNVVAHASDGRNVGANRKSMSSKTLKGSKLSIVFSTCAEGPAAQFLKLSLGLSHRYF
jgi:hypothetical protein